MDKIITSGGREIAQHIEYSVRFEDLRSPRSNGKKLSFFDPSNKNELKVQVKETGLTLEKGDIVYIDSGDFKGHYIVKEKNTTPNTQDLKLSYNPNVKQGEKVTYSTGEPTLYKCTFIEPNTIKQIKLGGVEKQTTTFQCISDQSPVPLTGSFKYGDISLSIIYDTSSAIYKVLTDHFNGNHQFAVVVQRKEDEIKLFTCQLNKLDNPEINTSEGTMDIEVVCSVVVGNMNFSLRG